MLSHIPSGLPVSPGSARSELGVTAHREHRPRKHGHHQMLAPRTPRRQAIRSERSREAELGTEEDGGGREGGRGEEAAVLPSSPSLGRGLNCPLTPTGHPGSPLTSSLGRMLYRMRSAFSLSCLLSMMASSSLEALFWGGTEAGMGGCAGPRP